MKKIKIIIFSIFIIVFIVTSTVFITHIASKADKYYISINNDNFLPHVEMNYEDIDKKNMKVSLDDIDSVKYNLDSQWRVYHELIIEDKAPENTLSYSFYGDYNIKDRVLYINEKEPLTQNYSDVEITIKEDIPDFITYPTNYCNGYDYDIEEKVNKIIQNLGSLSEVYNINIDKKLDQAQKEDNLYVALEWYDGNIEDVKTLNQALQNGGVVLEGLDAEGVYVTSDSLSVDNCTGNKQIINDNQGYEYTIKDQEIILENIDTNKKWDIPFRKELIDE